MTGSAQLLLWIAGVHLVGLLCVGMLLLPVLKEDPSTPNRSDSDGDDGWGHGPKVPPTPRTPPRGGIPLPDADQSRIRLREPGRISEQLPSRVRRPSREPERNPAREPGRRPVRSSSQSGLRRRP